MLKATEGNTTVYYTRGFELISRREGTTASYYVYDGGLSVRSLTNESGAVTDTLVFDAFGNETGRTGTTDNPYGFQGEEQDATGLYYLRARYMDPATGTFTTMDTYGGSLSDPMSLHKYLFANSNPVRYSDPSGHFSMSEQMGVIDIQSILFNAFCSAFSYTLDWILNDPYSDNHSEEGLLGAILLGAIAGYLGGLISEALQIAGVGSKLILQVQNGYPIIAYLMQHTNIYMKISAVMVLFLWGIMAKEIENDVSSNSQSSSSNSIGDNVSTMLGVTGDAFLDSIFVVTSEFFGVTPGEIGVMVDMYFSLKKYFTGG